MGRFLTVLLLALNLAALGLAYPAQATTRHQRVHVSASSLSAVRVQCRDASLRTVHRGHTAVCRVIYLRAACSTTRYTWVVGAGPWHTVDCGWRPVGPRQRIVVGVANA